VIAVVGFWVSLGAIVWLHFGYPAVLALVARVRPCHRYRAPLHLPVSVIVAAHHDESVIAAKVANIRASIYPDDLLEIIVASDGSRREAAARAVGSVFVFTDAESRLTGDAIAQLVSNFIDPTIGAVAGNEIRSMGRDGETLAPGEGLYWKYEQLLNRLEGEIGTTVWASPRLSAVRRDVFVPSDEAASTDDFVTSMRAIRSGLRVVFDPDAHVVVERRDHGSVELRRTVRLMNRGVRGSIALAVALLPARRPGSLFALRSHEILRRSVGFLLAALLGSTVVLASSNPSWWVALAPQLVLYALALAGLMRTALARTPSLEQVEIA
jgi:poly-beta-1,6-N-acetyl-D-glucosamine synthase